MKKVTLATESLSAEKFLLKCFPFLMLLFNFLYPISFFRVHLFFYLSGHQYWKMYNTVLKDVQHIIEKGSMIQNIKSLLLSFENLLCVIMKTLYILTIFWLLTGGAETGTTLNIIVPRDMA